MKNQGTQVTKHKQPVKVAGRTNKKPTWRIKLISSREMKEAWWLWCYSCRTDHHINTIRNVVSELLMMDSSFLFNDSPSRRVLKRWITSWNNSKRIVKSAFKWKSRKIHYSSNSWNFITKKWSTSCDYNWNQSLFSPTKIINKKSVKPGTFC